MRPPNAITTFMHHPALTGPWLRYNAQLLQRPALDPRHRELIVLRVAWRAKAQYEWVQHIRLATRYGITAEEIEAVTRWPSGGEWPALEADLLTATDELLDEFRIRDETWKRLAGQLDVKQLLELLFVAGTYTTLAMAFNSLGVATRSGARSRLRPGDSGTHQLSSSRSGARMNDSHEGETLHAARAMRRAMLGDAYVDSVTADPDPVAAEFQDYVTSMAWGVWARGGPLSTRDRSLLVMAMTAALGRMDEFRLHAGAAPQTGVTDEEIDELLFQIAAYCGAPAGIAARRNLLAVRAARNQQ